MLSMSGVYYGRGERERTLKVGWLRVSQRVDGIKRLVHFVYSRHELALPFFSERFEFLALHRLVTGWIGFSLRGG